MTEADAHIPRTGYFALENQNFKPAVSGIDLRINSEWTQAICTFGKFLQDASIFRHGINSNACTRIPYADTGEIDLLASQFSIGTHLKSFHAHSQQTSTGSCSSF